MNHQFLVTIFTILLIPGTFMCMFPGLPGLLYMFTISLLFAFLDSFVHLTASNLIILGLVLLLATIIDFTAGLVGAKHGGANKKSLISGFLGMLIGTFLIPIPIVGTFAGFFIGIYAGELLQRKNNKKAMKAATSGVIGALAGSAVNVIISIAFIITFVVFSIQ